MTKTEASISWSERARSNLEIAKSFNQSENIFYEDLCFNAQQCVEKSLKGYCIFIDIDFPKTHSIAKLLTIIENADIKIPLKIKASASLSDYSVEKRYPGNYDEVNEKEYKSAVRIATDVYNWVSKKIEK